MRAADADSTALRRLVAKYVLFIAESRSRRTASNCNVKNISCFLLRAPILTVRRPSRRPTSRARDAPAPPFRQTHPIGVAHESGFPLVIPRQHSMRRARHAIEACTRAIEIKPTSLFSSSNPRLGRRDMHAASLARARIAAPRFIAGGASSAARLQRRAVAPVVSRSVDATWKINRGFSVVVESAEGDVEGEESAEDATSVDAPVAEEQHKLYIGNLSWNASVDDLKAAFGEFNVTEADVVLDRNTGRSRGFGFVTVASAEDLERAVEAMNGHEIDGREVRVSKAQSAGERPERPLRMPGERRQMRREPDNRRVYFGNLSWGMDHLDLQDLCSEFGSVEDSRLITDRETGRSRGFGFVTMSSEAEADEVVAQLNGQDVDGRVLRVNIANS